jgi:hypothetical protein
MKGHSRRAFDKWRGKGPRKKSRLWRWQTHWLWRAWEAGRLYGRGKTVKETAPMTVCDPFCLGPEYQSFLMGDTKCTSMT